MLKIILSGCFGKMGKAICESVAIDNDCVIAAGVDIISMQSDFPVFKSFNEIEGKADIVIDFSNPNVLESLLNYAVNSGTPAVIATTGLNEKQKEMINDASLKIPVFFTANMSLGINLMLSLVKLASAALGDKFDIEIIEKHHNQKIDAPSGTALMLANAASEALPYSADYIYDRHSQRKKRSKNEIGIHAIRGGTIVGEHEVIFAGEDEILSISHSAGSKKVLANGAIKAAKYLYNKPAGFYNMESMLKEINII